MESTRSVSYTHLDVYKRQPFVTAVKEHIVVKKALGDELIERMERLF